VHVSSRRKLSRGDLRSGETWLVKRRRVDKVLVRIGNASLTSFFSASYFFGPITALQTRTTPLSDTRDIPDSLRRISTPTLFFLFSPNVPDTFVNPATFRPPSVSFVQLWDAVPPLVGTDEASNEFGLDGGTAERVDCATPRWCVLPPFSLAFFIGDERHRV
jgi:hypothetical protein